MDEKGNNDSLNWNRLENENRRLRSIVNDHESAILDLQRKYYELLTYVKGKEIEEYLENYKTKNKKNTNINDMNERILRIIGVGEINKLDDISDSFEVYPTEQEIKETIKAELLTEDP